MLQMSQFPTCQYWNSINRASWEGSWDVHCHPRDTCEARPHLEGAQGKQKAQHQAGEAWPPRLGQPGGSLSDPKLPLEQAGSEHFCALTALLHCSNTCSKAPVETPHPRSRLWLRTRSEHPGQCLLTLVSVFPSLPVHSEAGCYHLLPAPSHNPPVSSSAEPAGTATPTPFPSTKASLRGL